MYFMDHWAKPLFVLLSSPLASIGWWGIKLFNTICVLLSIYYASKVFEYYVINKWWAVFLSFFSFSFFLIQSSGLTEPLFTLFLTVIVYLEIKDNTKIAFVLLSFLPFVRSEGWIIGCIIVVYALYAKKYKYLPYLLLGTVIYGIAGLFVYQDFLWMFHQNPYSGVEAKYGSGSALHFVNQLPYLIGLPIYILVFLGFFKGGLDFFKGRIYGVCLGYIVAYSIFWRYGMFHSYGLTRVILVIVPLLSYIAFKGLEWLVCALYFLPKKGIVGVFIFAITIFPFIGNKMAMGLPHSFQLKPNQVLAQDCSTWLIEQNLADNPIYTNVFFLPLTLDKKIETSDEVTEMKYLTAANDLDKGTLIIWDSYFSVTDAEITQEFIESNFNCNELKSFKNKSGYKMVVYTIE